MAELATLARPYANAVFDVAKTSPESLAIWSRRLAMLAAALEDDDFRRRLHSPTLSDEARATLLADLVADELDSHGRNLIRLLAENDRLELLPHIRARFERLKAEAEQTVDVEIVSAYELTSDELAIIDAALRERFEGRGINVATRVDPSLVGGAIVRAGDLVIDGSLQGRLAKLRESLLRA